jgi:hypothetical protein
VQPVIRNDDFDSWLDNEFAALVDSFSSPAEVEIVLNEVLLAGARRRVARRIVSDRVGGPLVVNAIVDISRYFRRERPGKVSLHQVCGTMKITPNAAEEALRHFVLAGILAETEVDGSVNAPSRWYYELTEKGNAVMAEIVSEADARQRAGGAVRTVRGAVWEGA